MIGCHPKFANSVNKSGDDSIVFEVFLDASCLLVVAVRRDSGQIAMESRVIARWRRVWSQDCIVRVEVNRPLRPVGESPPAARRSAGRSIRRPDNPRLHTILAFAADYVLTVKSSRPEQSRPEHSRPDQGAQRRSSGNEGSSSLVPCTMTCSCHRDSRIRMTDGWRKSHAEQDSACPAVPGGDGTADRNVSV